MKIDFVKIFYQLFVALAFYDAFGNFYDLYLRLYVEVKRKSDESKFDRYFIYLFESRVIPLFKALIRRDVWYPIVLYIIPLLLDNYLGEGLAGLYTSNLFKNSYIWLLFVIIVVARPYIKNDGAQQ